MNRSERRVGLMATYPARIESLQETVKTLAPQLDKLYIYCNDYDFNTFVWLLNRLKKYSSTCKIQLIDPDFGVGNVMDMGKYWAIHDVEGYVFLVDDDLLYPDNYCERHIAFMDEYKCITTVHGRSLRFYPIHSYFGNTKSINYKIGLPKGKIVDIAGTGTCAFHTDVFSFDKPVPDALLESYAGMSDVFLTVRARNEELSFLAIPRPVGWLQDTKGSEGKHTLYDRFRKNTSAHCALINRLEWPHVPQVEGTV